MANISTSAFVRALECGDVDFRHLHHRLHHAAGLHGVLVTHELAECRRNDLPRETELVLEPAALALRAAFAELLPERVDLLLRLAVDEHGDGLVELEVRAAVEAH